MYEDEDISDSKAETNRTKEPNELVLSYLICPQDAAGAFLGALMLTDARLRPLHFSFVSPIRPTKIQRVLYGPTLDEHLRVDVIGNRLIKDLPFVPDVLLVDRLELVAARRVANIPTAFLTKPNDGAPEPGKLTALQYDTGPNVEDQEVVGQILASLEMTVDLVEPFNRMREALKEAIKTGETRGG
jgi:hypothetical protein